MNDQENEEGFLKGRDAQIGRLYKLKPSFWFNKFPVLWFNRLPQLFNTPDSAEILNSD